MSKREPPESTPLLRRDVVRWIAFGTVVSISGCHWVTEPNGSIVYIPIRVLVNGNGSEVVFTLYRLPGMSDEHYARDATAVQRDLDTLKRVLEKR
ncbi:hypothetical protein [Labilithrix luteola]|nr:hypothetical protein [Labilithrix luteola]